MSGKIYMIPCPIVEWEMDTIPNHTINTLQKLDTFVVERLRTARRYISKCDHEISIDDMTFFEYDKHNPSQGLEAFLSRVKKGQDIGVLSEAGCPGIADPGRNVVEYAHKNNIQVVPLVGPSSILLALMASGFNGQSFTFHGYLPNKKGDLSSKLKQLESRARNGETQMFIEAPYRNKFIIESCISCLSANTKLCVAIDINADSEYIKTMSVSDWKKIDLNPFHKRPAMFLIGS